MSLYTQASRRYNELILSASHHRYREPVHESSLLEHQDPRPARREQPGGSILRRYAQIFHRPERAVEPEKEVGGF